MKTTSAYIFVAALSPLSAYAQTPQLASEPLVTVRSYLKAWSSLADRRGITDRDVTATINDAAQYFDGDSLYINSNEPLKQQGIGVIRDSAIKPMLTSFPNARWEMTGDPQVTGESVQFSWVITGNDWGPYFSDPTCAGKGDRLELHGNSTFVVRNGIIASQTDQYDAKQIPLQLTRSAAACVAQKADETKKADAAKTFAVGGNFALVSNYMFRGISVSDRRPAVQGGIDVTHPAGGYFSVWGSSVSEAAYNHGIGLEFDVLTGFKWDLGDNLSLDTGLAFYNYPGAQYLSYTGDGSMVKYNTQELKLGLSQDVYNATLWYGLNRHWAGIDFNRSFEKTSTRGSIYLELNANPVASETVTINLHAGRQIVKNSPIASFSDFKIGVTADAAFMAMPGWSASAAVVRNTGSQVAWGFFDRDGNPARNSTGTNALISLSKVF